MQAQMSREGEVVVVHLSGRLDIESAEPFRHACMNFLSDKKVVFDFRDLSFVGSSGILPFLETMQKLSSVTKTGFKFCHVGSEFKKVFAASPLQTIEIYEDEGHAMQAFVNPGAVPIAAEAVPLNNEGYGFLSLNAEPDDSGVVAMDEDDEEGMNA